MLPFNPFAAPEYADFSLPGGPPAALLVHGFPGTPREMRPLAEALHASGWTCRGLLLPGFGPDLDSLPQRTADDWLSAILDALAALRREHAPLLLLGHSMGAALCLAAAARSQPDGLVLLAPFWKVPGPLWPLIPVLKTLIPTVQPFRLQRVDLTAPHIRAELQKFVPGADLDDPAVRLAIQNFTVPLSIFDAMRTAGQLGYRAAPHVACPTLLIQGLQDETVRPALTRRLAARLPVKPTLLSLQAGHDLPFPAGPAFPRVRQAVLSFAEQIRLDPNQFPDYP